MSKRTVNDVNGTLNDGLYEIADAIREHAKSINNLTQTVRWSFMDDWDNNIPNKLEQLANALKDKK